MRNALLILLLLLISCKTPEKQGIRIEGRSTGQPDGMLYLVDARNWQTILDSADSRSGSFLFELPADTGFIPLAVAIHFFPKGDRLHPVRLSFRNHVLPDIDPPLQRDHFWLETGTTRIEGKNHPDSLLQIHAGPETELMMRHQLSDIGWMGDRDSITRNNKMVTLNKAIRQSPRSFFLIESIYRSKELYTKAEMTELLSLFEPPVSRSAPWNKLSGYLQLLPGKGAPYPLIFLPGKPGQRLAIYDTSSRLNMIVFWASWCRPCRMEIPQLKKLYGQFSERGLTITSISIDQDKKSWEQALQQEEMPWRQLIIPADSIERVENIFRFSTIPFLVFTNAQGVEIARFSDYDEAAILQYEKIIRAHIP